LMRQAGRYVRYTASTTLPLFLQAVNFKLPLRAI
jgi:hypothetical protein